MRANSGRRSGYYIIAIYIATPKSFFCQKSSKVDEKNYSIDKLWVSKNDFKVILKTSKTLFLRISMQCGCTKNIHNLTTSIPYHCAFLSPNKQSLFYILLQ